MHFSLPQHNVFFSFFIYSFCFGAFFPRIGDLQLQMNVGESSLGLALVGLPLGVQISLLFAERILAVIGFRLLLCLGIPTLGISLVISSLSYDPFSFFLSLFIGGLAVGVIEVAVNLEADRTEYRIKKKIMNRSHSFWSLGFFTAGLIGAFLSQIEISPLVHFGLSFLVVSFLAIIFSFGFQPSPKRPNTNVKSPIFVRPTKGVLALVVFTLSAMLIEGAGIDWSIIFMRDVFSTPPFLNGLAFVLGAFAQFIVRFFADTIVESYGPVNVSRVSIISMFIGLIFVCFSRIWSSLSLSIISCCRIFSSFYSLFFNSFFVYLSFFLIITLSSYFSYSVSNGIIFGKIGSSLNSVSSEVPNSNYPV